MKIAGWGTESWTSHAVSVANLLATSRRRVHGVDHAALRIAGEAEQIGNEHGSVSLHFGAQRLRQLPDALDDFRAQIQIRLAQSDFQNARQLCDHRRIQNALLLRQQRGQRQHSGLADLPAVLFFGVAQIAENRSQLASKTSRTATSFVMSAGSSRSDKVTGLVETAGVSAGVSCGSERVATEGAAL